MKRCHSSERIARVKKPKVAVVYAFTALAPAFGNNKAGARREVYLSHKSTVDLYNFDAAYLAQLRVRHPETHAHFGQYFTRLLTIKLNASRIFGSVADDIRQETLLRVLKAVQADKVHEPEKLGPYVFSVCNNVIKEWRRGEWTNWDGNTDEELEVADPAAGPEESVRRDEMRKTVSWVLERVSEKDRRILIAVFLEEKEKEDICREFNVSREYLRVLLHRALLSARKLLGKGPAS